MTSASKPLTRNELEAAMKRQWLRTYLNPKTIWALLRQLKRNSTSFWYTYLGDDVLEGLNGGFQDAGKAKWLNLGYWKNANTYPEAAEALAMQLAQAAGIQQGDTVLDVGFGFGEQDVLWAKQFDIRIKGVNVTPVHVEKAMEIVRENDLEQRIDLQVGSATELPYDDASFDKAVALESAFHFETRETFFDEALRVLKPGGTLALADMLPMPNKQYNLRSSWLTRRRSGWPKANLYDREVYVQKLQEHGFVDIQCRSIREYVYTGMYLYSMQRMAGVPSSDIHVELTPDDIAECTGAELWENVMGVGDYVLVTAKKPA